MSDSPEIASCACGASFDVYDIDAAEMHITTDSSSAHHWVHVDPTVGHLIGNHLVYSNPPRVICNYEQRREQCMDKPGTGKKD